MSNQNRALVLFMIFAIFVVGWLLLREGLFKSPHSAEPAAIGTQDQMGDPAPAEPAVALVAPTAESSEAQLQRTKMVEILNLMKTCLSIESSPPENMAMTTDGLLEFLQTEFGNAESTDRWRNWHFRTRDGQERRLRLEVATNEDGTVSRELHYFAVDNEGLPIPIPLNDVPAHNPPNEVLDHFLSEGDVFMREHAAGLGFTGGERMEYQERDGMIEEFELQKGDTVFRCSGRQNPSEECQCVE